VRAGRRWSTAIGAGASLLALAAAVPAADPPAPPPTEIYARERPTMRSFYGWQILASGGVGGTVAAAAIVLTDSPLKAFPSAFGFLTGAPLFVLGGPATHWTHGEFQKGLVSLAGNFVLPGVAGFVGQEVNCAPSDAASDCGARGFFSGMAIALVTVPVIDALVLGWEDLPVDDPEAPSAPAAVTASAEVERRSRRARIGSQLRMIPTWNLGPRGEVAFGVAGRF
jgi:hypothetical protein